MGRVGDKKELINALIKDSKFPDTAETQLSVPSGEGGWEL